MDRKNLIEELIKEGYLKSPEIIAAFYKIRRRDFLPKALKLDEGINAPLPIGEGQTISQPLTVAFMLELLQPQAGQKILDIGSGSAWQTALLADLVGPKGEVWAMERIPALLDFGQNNIAKYHFTNITFTLGDGSRGLPNEAPFDRIVVAAAAPDIPEDLKAQLKIGGRLVIPVGGNWSQDLVLIEREGEHEFKRTNYPGFRFVPLISDKT